jgi:undecaprenyl-diphosphatase
MPVLHDTSVAAQTRPVARQRRHRLAVELALAFGCCAGGFAWVLAEVLGGGHLVVLDHRWHAEIVASRTAWLTHLAKIVTWLGAPAVWWAAMLIVCALLLWRRHGPIAVAVIAIAGLGSGELLRSLTCALVGRPRPPRADWLVEASGKSFPSGHSAMAVLGGGLLLALLWPTLHATWLRVVSVVAAVIGAAAIGLSRLYLGVHWPSDVLGGWLFGALWLTVVLAVLTVWRQRAADHAAQPEQLGQAGGSDAAAGHAGAGVRVSAG